jgi:regulator of protease activity HflC (stomatin/prohibitin superfamily)
LALVGFVIFLGGAALAVMSASQGRPVRGGVFLAVIGLIMGALFSLVSQGLLFVEPTQVAIVANTLSGTVDKPRGSGTHVIIPGVQQVVATYDITQQEYTMSGRVGEGARANEDDAVVAQTKDGQTIRMDITVLFRVVPDKADVLYRDLRTQANVVNNFVRPITRSLVRETASRYTAEQIYGVDRVKVGIDLKQIVSDRFLEKNLEVIDVLMRDVTFSDDFANAIEQKVVAAQNLERAKTDAERAKTEAEGRANAAIAAAQGDSQAKVLRAQADAEALRLVSQQIAANPSLIQYLYVQNLSDQVSLVLLPSNSPFLFDLASLGKGNSNFAAPAVPQVQPEATATPNQ